MKLVVGSDGVLCVMIQFDLYDFFSMIFFVCSEWLLIQFVISSCLFYLYHELFYFVI